MFDPETMQTLKSELSKCNTIDDINLFAFKYRNTYKSVKDGLLFIDMCAERKNQIS